VLFRSIAHGAGNVFACAIIKGMDEQTFVSPWPPRLQAFSRATCAIAIAIGVLVLLGWSLDNETLKRIIPGLVAMNPMTAVCFIAAGGALWLRRDETGSTPIVAQGLAWSVAAIGFLKLCEIAGGPVPGIDRLLFRARLDAEAAAGFANRMAPNTAFCFLMTGLSIALLDAHWKRFWPAQFLALLGAAASLLALVGYAYGTTSFYGVGSFIPMALHTAAAFLLLLMGVLHARPQRGLMQTISSASDGGQIARLLLPSAIGIPFALGWLCSIAARKSWLNADAGLSLFVVLNMATFAILVWWNAGVIRRADMARRATAWALEESHEALSKRNTEMQADLDLAREIQQAFLPQQYISFPRLSEPLQSALQFHHRYQPASTLGGDFTDVLILSDTRVGVFICDVMGHGVRSALVTAVTRGLIEELLPSTIEPGQFLSALNKGLMTILKRTRTPMFASAFFLVADVETKTMTFANAGHPSPLHLQRESKIVAPLARAESHAGPALGVIEDFCYQSLACPLQSGDLFLLFTDGLVEVARGDDEYGEERLQQAVARRSRMSATSLLDELIEEIKNFGDEKFFEDDVCLVGMEVTRA
jgi:serine phosphatase RsbU (regulator of sigma subunit)